MASQERRNHKFPVRESGGVFPEILRFAQSMGIVSKHQRKVEPRFFFGATVGDRYKEL